MNIPDQYAALRKGLMELAVLKVISRHKAYAADILVKLNATDFATGEGTLYPLLSRLKREELLEYEWVESEAGPPRKYYKLTTTGKEHLKQQEAYWNSLHRTIKELGETHA